MAKTDRKAYRPGASFGQFFDYVGVKKSESEYKSGKSLYKVKNMC